MFSKLKMHSVTAFALTLAMGSLAYGGGYWLEFGSPSASADPAAKGAIVLVRAVGCGEPAKSVMIAAAEGLVNGERKSLPLELVPLQSPGLYAVKGKMPAEGTWAVTVVGKYNGVEAGALTAINAKGSIRATAKSTRNRVPREEIDALLTSIGGH